MAALRGLFYQGPIHSHFIENHKWVNRVHTLYLLDKIKPKKLKSFYPANLGNGLGAIYYNLI